MNKRVYMFTLILIPQTANKRWTHTSWCHPLFCGQSTNKILNLISHIIQIMTLQMFWRGRSLADPLSSLGLKAVCSLPTCVSKIFPVQSNKGKKSQKIMLKLRNGINVFERSSSATCFCAVGQSSHSLDNYQRSNLCFCSGHYKSSFFTCQYMEINWSQPQVDIFVTYIQFDWLIYVLLVK